MPATERAEWRVLFVPDSIYWVTGTLCKEIAGNHPWIRPTICSTRVLTKLLQRDRTLVKRIDLVHFLDPWAPSVHLAEWSPLVPCIGSIHHVGPKVVEANAGTDVVTVGSRQWLDDLLARGEVHEDCLALMPYGVDTTRFQPATPGRRERCRRRLRIRPDACVIGFIAKESSDTRQRKGVDVLLAGLGRLKVGIPNLVLVIVGPGWGQVVAQLRTAGIDCRWTPYLSNHAELVDVYHALDVFWVTARVEGGPLTLLEAMSCGICCVTTPVGIAREVVRDSVNAFLAPIGDVESLVRKTELLAQDASLRGRMGGAASASVRETRSWENATRGIYELYGKAARRFCERTGKPAPPPDPPPRRSRRDSSPFPLNSVAPPLRRWVRMLEILYWLEGDFHDSPLMTRRLSWRACLANPWSPTPWARLLRASSPEIHRRLSLLRSWLRS